MLLYYSQRWFVRINPVFSVNMATIGTEKYTRIALTLVKGGTKLTRKFFEKRIKDLSPQGHEWTIDGFLLKHKTRILQSNTGKNKTSVYFPDSGTTDLEQWDLHMLCFILLETCDLTTPLRMYVKKLQKMRNKLSYLKEPTLEDDEYQDYTDKLEICFNKCLEEINDSVFTTEIDEMIKLFKTGPLTLDGTIKHTHMLYQMEFEQREILEKHSEERKEMNDKIDKALDKLERIETRMPYMSVDVPDFFSDGIVLLVTKMELLVLRIQTEIGHKFNVTNLSVSAQQVYVVDSENGRFPKDEGKTLDPDSNNVSGFDVIPAASEDDHQLLSSEVKTSRNDLESLSYHPAKEEKQWFKHRKNTKYKQSKENTRSMQTAQPSTFKRQLTSKDDTSTSYCGKETTKVSKRKQKTSEELQTVATTIGYENETVIFDKTRMSSVCSTSTEDSFTFGSLPESSLKSRGPGYFSDVESFDNIFFSREETTEEQAPQEEMSFFEQSKRFYLQCRESSEHIGKADPDEKILKHGIKLNNSYMHQFQDMRLDVLKGDRFYTDFLDKKQLKQKLLQNPKKYIRCVIQIEGSHEAYCTPLDTNGNMNVIEISGRSKIGQAFNEDEVIVEIIDEKDVKGKRYGQVIGIWNRQRHKDTTHPVFFCILDDMERNLVRPLCKTIPKIQITEGEILQKYKTFHARKYKLEIYDYDAADEILCNPKIIRLNPADQQSYIFLVAFISWDPRHIYPRGVIIKMLPPGISEQTGLMILNLKHAVPTLYRKATVDQVESLSKRLGDEPTGIILQDRRNLTGLKTFTIDPPKTKDFDDALSVETIDGGYKVGVHIADVAVYVPQNSPLDEESRQRANTLYPGIRRPRTMLPEPFSTNMCSLLPNKTRLTLSIFFYITSKGRPMQMKGSNFEILKSFIRSSKQLTYDEAQHIITSPNTEKIDHLQKDVKTLFKIAKAIRKHRLGNAMFAMDLESEESEERESDNQTKEAHYLVEEFMIMANKKVADWLLRQKCKGYSQCVPLRFQPPPSKENLETFLMKNNCYLDTPLRLQDKQIGPKRSSFHEYLSADSTKAKSVMLVKAIWEAMLRSPKTAAEYLTKDDLHPIQQTVYQDWLSIQEKAGYRCSGSIKDEEDCKYASLDIYPYTHLTSPISRYIDLIVQRLVHAALTDDSCPYEKQDIDSLCLHINSVTKRSKEYEKGCKTLKMAVEFMTNPKMLNCCVDDVSDRSISLCSPVLKIVPKQHKELTFSLLDIGNEPEVIEDLDTKWNKVSAVWRKRLYDFVEKPNYQPAKDIVYKLNPHRGVVFLPIFQWARMLKATIDGNEEDLVRELKNASTTTYRLGYDDVTTECQNPLKIQPNTKFSMVFSRGQLLQIQMSAAPKQGIITPRPVLYSMTNNVKFCLQHTENPVLHLYRYATRSSCDQYPHVRSYVERWLPIILMEAATGVVHNEESCCINNVVIHFVDARKGEFSLELTECEIRNIELSGSMSEDGKDARSDERSASYDWLCLKAVLPNPIQQNTKGVQSDFQNLNAVWVGHAEVIEVVMKKHQQSSDGKVNVTFQLHAKTPALPSSFPAYTSFSVEILKKSKVDRITESFIKKLQFQSESLAAKIALNTHIPDFASERSRAHIAKLWQDLNFVTNKNDATQRKHVLPRNNAKQQEAVNKALTSRFSLIQGPPGTGKTYTGIKLLYLFDRINYQLTREGHQRKQVLFCGQSNESVDLVAKWMLQKMDNYKPNFIRVYGTSKELTDFPIPGKTFLSKRSTRGCHTDPDLKSVSLHHLIRQKGKKYAEEISAKDQIFKDNNYEQMPDIVKEYVRTVREASIDEIRKYDVILCTTAVSADPKVLEATDVYQVIVDDAGMCQEPQCLVPIIATKAEHVVLIGDHKQLKPNIICKEAALLGLDTSLFERYATSTSSKNVQFTRLEQQYRMNPEICRFPSKMFYDSALQTMSGIWRDETMTIWPKDARGIYPHVFVHIEGEEHFLTVSTENGNHQSIINDAEIDHVITTYQYLTREVPNESIQILSQYNAQCSEIKKKLKQEGFENSEESVSTVVSCQGGEWNYVIFSTVRSLPDYKIEKNPTLGWCKHNLGFITDKNQVNVALTRASKGLIIIGNKDLLTCDYVWKCLIQQYDQRRCIKSPEEFPPMNIRKSRRQIMTDAITRSYRRN